MTLFFYRNNYKPDIPSYHVQANYYATSSITHIVSGAGQWHTPTGMQLSASFLEGFTLLTGSQKNQFRFDGGSTARHFMVDYNINCEANLNQTIPVGIGITINGILMSGSIMVSQVGKTLNGSRTIAASYTTPLNHNDVLCPVVTNFLDTTGIDIYSIQCRIIGEH